MLGDIDDLIRSNQGERTIISETITTLIDSALDVADLSVNEGDLSRDQKKAIEGLEAGLVKLIKSDIILEHNVTSLRELRDNAKRRMSKEQDDDDDDDDDETTFKPAAEPTLDDIKKHPKFREFYKRVWKKDLDRRSGDESDDDDDLAVVNNQISLVCPITKTIFVNPVKNKNCGHTYSREAILEYLRTNKDNRESTPCPVAGCSAKVAKSSLEEDADMIFELKRAERRKELQFSQTSGEQNTQSYVDL